MKVRSRFAYELFTKSGIVLTGLFLQACNDEDPKKDEQNKEKEEAKKKLAEAIKNCQDAITDNIDINNDGLKQALKDAGANDNDLNTKDNIKKFIAKLTDPSKVEAIKKAIEKATSTPNPNPLDQLKNDCKNAITNDTEFSNKALQDAIKAIDPNAKITKAKELEDLIDKCSDKDKLSKLLKAIQNATKKPSNDPLQDAKDKLKTVLGKIKDKITASSVLKKLTVTDSDLKDPKSKIEENDLKDQDGTKVLGKVKDDATSIENVAKAIEDAINKVQTAIDDAKQSLQKFKNVKDLSTLVNVIKSSQESSLTSVVSLLNTNNNPPLSDIENLINGDTAEDLKKIFDANKPKTSEQQQNQNNFDSCMIAINSIDDLKELVNNKIKDILGDGTKLSDILIDDTKVTLNLAQEITLKGAVTVEGKSTIAQNSIIKGDLVAKIGSNFQSQKKGWKDNENGAVSITENSETNQDYTVHGTKENGSSTKEYELTNSAITLATGSKIAENSVLKEGTTLEVKLTDVVNDFASLTVKVSLDDDCKTFQDNVKLSIVKDVKLKDNLNDTLRSDISSLISIEKLLKAIDCNSKKDNFKKDVLLKKIIEVLKKKNNEKITDDTLKDVEISELEDSALLADGTNKNIKVELAKVNVTVIGGTQENQNEQSQENKQGQNAQTKEKSLKEYLEEKLKANTGDQNSPK